MHIIQHKKYRFLKKFSLLSTYRVKSYFFSLLFGGVIVMLYYAIHWLSPGEMLYYEQAVTLIFIIISVLILFPARETILRRILKDSEYSFFFGKDSHHFDLIARHFSKETLIDEVFPEMMEWLEVKNGRFAVIESDRKHFYFYTYKKGVVHKKESAYYSILEESLEYLAGYPKLIYRNSPDIAPEILELMEKFRAEIIQPIIYRKTLMGFLILGELPRHRYSERALELFADKAALSIHTSVLSGRVVDLAKYDQEFQTAARIRKFLQNNAIRQIPGFEIKNIRAGHVLSLTEIFSVSETRWYMVIIYSSRAVGAAGLILAGILGHLYSLIHRKELVSLSKLSSHLRKDAGLNRSEFKMDMFIAEFNLDENSAVIIPDYNFEIVEKDSGNKIELNTGWRNVFEFKEAITYNICHGKISLLEIHKISQPHTSAPALIEKRASDE